MFAIKLSELLLSNQACVHTQGGRDSTAGYYSSRRTRGHIHRDRHCRSQRLHVLPDTLHTARNRSLLSVIMWYNFHIT